MNRLDYIAHYCEPEQIIEEVTTELAAKDKEIARLKAMVQELKCCGNCKWDLDLYESNCLGCHEPDLNKWEPT
jgi:hypothetical protein